MVVWFFILFVGLVVCVGDGGCGGYCCWSGSGGDYGWVKGCCSGYFLFYFNEFFILF